MATVLLIRHGRTAANASGVLAGWTPGVELDEEGRRQAAACADRLAGITPVEIVTSPLTRTLQTTDVLRERAWPEVPVTECDRIGECRYGAWTGQPLTDLMKDPLWSAVQSHPSSVTFPPSAEFAHESLAAMSARAVAAVRETDARIMREHGDDAVWVAVSHGDVIKAVLADAAGTPFDLFQRFAVGPASVSAIRYTPERPYLLRVNDTGDDRGPVTGDAARGSAGVVGGGR